MVGADRKLSFRLRHTTIIYTIEGSKSVTPRSTRISKIKPTGQKLSQFSSCCNRRSHQRVKQEAQGWTSATNRHRRQVRHALVISPNMTGRLESRSPCVRSRADERLCGRWLWKCHDEKGPASRTSYLSCEQLRISQRTREPATTNRRSTMENSKSPDTVQGHRSVV